MPKRISALAILLAAAGCAHVQNRSPYDVWTPVKPAPAHAGLPKLSSEPAINGELAELAGAAVLPLQGRSQLTDRAASQIWTGRDDLSANILAGWTQRGLVIGGMVHDDQIVTGAEGACPLPKDQLKLFIDGRDARFGAADYSAGAYRLAVIPPLAGKAGAVKVIYGSAVALESSTRSVPGGWTFELLIPWSAFGGKPSRIALGCEIQDVDADEKGSAALANPASADLARNASQLIPFSLENKQAGALDTGVLIDSPAVVSAHAPEQITVTLAGEIARQGRKVRVSAAQAQLPNKPTWQAEADLSAVGQRDGVFSGDVAVSVPSKAQWPLGYSLLRADVLDDQENVIGFNQKLIACLGGTVDLLIGDISQAKVGQLAQRDPYKAAAWCGAAAAVGRLEESVTQEDAQDVGRRVSEAQARVRLLQGRTARVNRANLQDALVLGNNTGAEVTIEFPAAARSTITYNWGSIPLGEVEIRQFSSASNALEELEHIKARNYTSTDPRLPQKNLVTDIVLQAAPVNAEDLDYHANVFLWIPAENGLYAISPDDLALVRYDAVVELPVQHSNPATAVGIVQANNKAPVLSLDRASSFERVLLQGDPRSSKAFADVKWFTLEAWQGATTITLAEGDRLYSAVAPNAEAAVWMLRYALAGKPVASWQVNRLRQVILRDLALHIKPDGSKPPIAQSMFVGDFQNGRPAGTAAPASVVMLDGIYAQKDFSLLSDQPAKKSCCSAAMLADCAALNGISLGQWAQRTVVFSPAGDGQAIADAIRNNQSIGLMPEAGTLFVGSPELVNKAFASLAEADHLKRVRADRLRRILADSHPEQMLRSNTQK